MLLPGELPVLGRLQGAADLRRRPTSHPQCDEGREGASSFVLAYFMLVLCCTRARWVHNLERTRARTSLITPLARHR